jgi:hypothetical protein
MPLSRFRALNYVLKRPRQSAAGRVKVSPPDEVLDEIPGNIPTKERIE